MFRRKLGQDDNVLFVDDSHAFLWVFRLKLGQDHNVLFVDDSNAYKLF